MIPGLVDLLHLLWHQKSLSRKGSYLSLSVFWNDFWNEPTTEMQNLPDSQEHPGFLQS